MSSGNFPPLRYDDDLEAHLGECQLDGHEVGLCLWVEQATDDISHLRAATASILDRWSALREELCNAVREELVETGYLQRETPLSTDDIVPFLFGIRRDEEEIWYDVGFEVPSLLSDDEYVEIARTIDGSDETREVRSTE